MKKVLILSGSPRKGGNSDLLCDEFAKGAREAGCEVEKIRVADKNVHCCTACYHCRDHGGKCVFDDDMAEILQKMIDADTIVLASPVYFYSIDAQLKAVIDRTVARWLEVRDKDFWYIVTCADGEREAAERTVECFRGYADCVEGARERGVIYGTGVYRKGEIKDSPAMREAYKAGRSA
ncbi:MAG TPA: flavodoxin family protein [Candidatus Ornithoclostridium excrementipullorum]|nr:flavodoxin family protein [Candidatus Ornithoclostridium excrementipullorum]